MIERLKKLPKPLVLAVLLGFVGGVLWLGAIRFTSVHDDSIHYHANFAVYVNGKRHELKSPFFYEEVQSCSANTADDPKARAHMHNQESYVVHVHDQAATWGHFLANLGFVIAPEALKTDTVLFVNETDGKRLTFILNDEEVNYVGNRVIGDEDVLLINYGDEKSEVLEERFEKIPRDAHKYNDTADPAGCSGSTPITFTTRLKKALGLSD